MERQTIVNLILETTGLDLSLQSFRYGSLIILCRGPWPQPEHPAGSTKCKKISISSKEIHTLMKILVLEQTFRDQKVTGPIVTKQAHEEGISSRLVRKML